MEEKQMLNIMSDIIGIYNNLLNDEDVLTNDSFDYTLGYLIRKNYDKELKKYINEVDNIKMAKDKKQEVVSINFDILHKEEILNYVDSLQNVFVKFGTENKNNVCLFLKITRF